MGTADAVQCPGIYTLFYSLSDKSITSQCSIVNDI